MESYERVVVGEDIPPSEKYIRRPNREPRLDKLMRAIKIILKLARVDAYDLNGQVKDARGNVIEKSDVGRLTMQALNPGRLSIGEDQFIVMLHKAGIYPEELVNDHYKNKLNELYARRDQRSMEPQPVTRDVISNERPPRAAEPMIIQRLDPEMPRLDPAVTQTFVSYKRPAPRDDDEDSEDFEPVPRKRKATDGNISINSLASDQPWLTPNEEDEYDT